MSWTYNKLWCASQQLQETYLCSKGSSPATRPTQFLFSEHWGPFTRGTKWLGYEADHSFLSSSKFKNDSRYTSTSLYAFKLHKGTSPICGGRYPDELTTAPVFSLPKDGGCMVVCIHHTTRCHSMNPRSHREISCVFCVCACVHVTERESSVADDKFVSLLAHQHTLFQYKAFITYDLLLMLNVRIYVKNPHSF
jgi:hypothetical protein